MDDCYCRVQSDESSTPAQSEWCDCVSRTCSAAALDRSVADSYIAKSQDSSNAPLNGNIKGLFIVDTYMNTTAVTAVATAIQQGADLLQQAAAAECAALLVGSYSNAGNLSCTKCPSRTGSTKIQSVPPFRNDYIRSCSTS